MRQGACFYNKRLFYSRAQVSMTRQLNYRNIDLSLNRLDVGIELHITGPCF